MAIMKSGLLGPVIGKIGGAVGTNWKGKNVARSYAKPANPQTAAQTTQRTKFAYVVAFAQTILTSVIHKFWYGLNSGMSEFNSFMKKNIALTDETDGITIANFASVGSLEALPDLFAEYEVLAGNVNFSWTPACSGNGLGTDKICCVVYDRENNISFISDALEVRSTGGVTVSVGASRTTTELVCFAFAYRGTAQPYLISQSSSVMPVAA